MARRRTPERRLFFTWETRGSRLTFFSRRGMRVALAGAVVVWLASMLVQVETRHRATFATRATITNVMQAVEAYRADHEGRCPSGLAELVNPGSGQEPYLARLPEDGWGNSMRFRCPGRKHPRSGDVTSGGPSANFDEPDQVE